MSQITYILGILLHNNPLYQEVLPFSSIVRSMLLLILTLFLCFPSVLFLSASTSDKDNDDDNDSSMSGGYNGEDFEEQSSIQICCTWGSSLQDGKLTYNINDIDSLKDQRDAVRNAIEEWDSRIDPMDLERVSSTAQADIRIEFNDVSDKTVQGEEIAGETVTTFDQYGFLDNARVTIYKEPYGYELDTSEIEQIVKHEMGHALGLGHANFDGNLMAQRVNDGTETISECEVKAVVEANYWKLGVQNLDNTYPYFPEDDSTICEDDE
jgi:predicted Zn-dependent protease